jgi:hemin uptake protein HemP
VLVSARKLSETGAASESKELPAPAPIELQARAIQAPELDEGDGEIVIRRLDAA